MPSGHKAFLVHNLADVDLLLMHNKTFAAEYVTALHSILVSYTEYLILVADCDTPCAGSDTQFHQGRGWKSFPGQRNWESRLRMRKRELRRKRRGTVLDGFCPCVVWSSSTNMLVLIKIVQYLISTDNDALPEMWLDRVRPTGGLHGLCIEKRFKTSHNSSDTVSVAVQVGGPASTRITAHPSP